MFIGGQTYWRNRDDDGRLILELHWCPDKGGYRWSNKPTTWLMELASICRHHDRSVEESLGDIATSSLELLVDNLEERIWEVVTTRPGNHRTRQRLKWLRKWQIWVQNELLRRLSDGAT